MFEIGWLFEIPIYQLIIRQYSSAMSSVKFKLSKSLWNQSKTHRKFQNEIQLRISSGIDPKFESALNWASYRDGNGRSARMKLGGRKQVQSELFRPSVERLNLNLLRPFTLDLTSKLALYPIRNASFNTIYGLMILVI